MVTEGRGEYTFENNVPVWIEHTDAFACKMRTINSRRSFNSDFRIMNTADKPMTATAAVAHRVKLWTNNIVTRKKNK